MKKCSPITIFGILHSMDITSFEVVAVLIRIFRISVCVMRKVGLAVLTFRWSTHKAVGGPNTT